MVIKMTKQEARELMKKRRMEMEPQERERQNHVICHTLLEDAVWESLSWIYPFVSFGTEVDTLSVIRRVLAMQKEGRDLRIAVPRVDGQEMDFYEIHSMDDLAEGHYGILEPHSRCSKVIAEHGLMLIPGLAFDRRGGRVGYGGGYYDRYLSAHGGDGLYTWALAYDFQIVDEIDVDPHDIAPQRIITACTAITTE